MTSTIASLITCSFSGDLEICRLLCRSIDRFVPEEISHSLYVPARDIPLFAPLTTGRRAILAQEDLLPRWFWKAPLPSPKWRARLRLPRRNVYITPVSLPVRGWIAQQIMKISATLQARTDIVAHLDSDNVIIRPLTAAHLIRNGKVRFHADPAVVGLESHRPWYIAAARLLGLPPGHYYSADYIDQFVVWRRSVTESMVARIEATMGHDWQAALARTPAFAEYVLYGMFVERVLGPDAAGVFVEPRSLCHALWTGSIAKAEEEDAFLGALQPEQIACVIQSTIPMTLVERARVFTRTTQRAADFDAALGSQLSGQNL